MERWLPGRPPARLVAVDSTREMAELMAAELRPLVSSPVSSRSLWAHEAVRLERPRRLLSVHLLARRSVERLRLMSAAPAARA